MIEDKTPKRGTERLVSALIAIVRFGAPIQIVVFIVLANVFAGWLRTPFAHAIAALIVFLPSYWLIPKRKVGFAIYAVLCIILVAALALVEYVLIP